MAGVSRLQVYEALTKAGFTTNQAVGVMANAINESSLNPEAVNPAGPQSGVGLLQWQTTDYPGASSLVTGNPQADLTAQAKYAAQTIPKSALTGTTAAQIAGNIAALFERCAGCDPGGAQYNSRVANAATVEGWLISGNWPTTATGATAGEASAGTAGATTAPAATAPATTAATSSSAGNSSNLYGACIGTTFPHTSWCIRKSWMTAIIGGVCVAGGVLVALAGVAMLFRQTPVVGRAAGRAAGAAGELLAVFPPAETAGVALSGAAGRGNRTAASRAARREQSRREYTAQTQRSAERARSRARQYTAQTARMREQRQAAAAGQAREERLAAREERLQAQERRRRAREARQLTRPRHPVTRPLPVPSRARARVTCTFTDCCSHRSGR